MTSVRFWRVATVLASTAAAMAGGCSGNDTPCTTCAPIEGRYPLEFAAGTVPEDCTSLGVLLPRGALEIQRAGNALTATLDQVEMQGTLFQSNNFNLLGTQLAMDGGSSTQFSLSGTYTAGAPDGGVGELSGSFTGSYSRPSPQGTGRCSLQRPFTATQNRQP